MPYQSQGCGLDKERPFGFDISLFVYQYIPFFQPHNDVFRQGVLWDQTAWLRSDWKIKLSLNVVKLVFRHERWLLDIILPHSIQSFWAKILHCSVVALMRLNHATRFFTVINLDGPPRFTKYHASVAFYFLLSLYPCPVFMPQSNHLHKSWFHP